MGLQKITFDGASITAKVDADLYHFLLSNQVGIIKGFKNGVSVTVSNSTFNFKDGYVSIFGRIIYVEENTQISVVLDSNKKGLVVLGVNTTANTVSLYTKEQSGSYPSITQTNLLTNDGLYELVLCAYTKTATSITIDNTYEKYYITNYLTAVNDLKLQIKNDVSPRTVIPTKVSNGVYTVSNVDSQLLTRSVIFVQMTSSVVTFPGALLFIQIGSSASVGYRHTGSDHIMGFHYENGILSISCGSTSHQVNRVYIYPR